MKFVFYTVPAYGHINPVCGIIELLTTLGHRVIVYCTEEYSEKIKKTGAVFRPPPQKIDQVDFRRTNNAMLLAELSIKTTGKLLDQVIKLTETDQPDCIIHDSFSLWGKLAALNSKTPSVAYVPSMAINPFFILQNIGYLAPEFIGILKEPDRLIKIINSYNSLYQKIGLKPPLVTDLFSNEEKLNLVLTSKYFQPVNKTFPGSYKFVGPIIYDRQEGMFPKQLMNKGKPLIYMALGTIFNDNLNHYKKFITALNDTNYQIAISVGKHLDINWFKRFKNIYATNYLPQLEMLKNASLFISHGGMNSINESLYYGVPMLLFPYIQEQRFNAGRVEKLGAGIYVKNADPDENILKKYISKLINDDTYRLQAKKIGKTLQDAGGRKKAVEYIINFAKKKSS